MSEPINQTGKVILDHNQSCLGDYDGSPTFVDKCILKLSINNLKEETELSSLIQDLQHYNPGNYYIMLLKLQTHEEPSWEILSNVFMQSLLTITAQQQK